MTPPLPHPRHLYEPFLKEPISSVKGIIISMKDIKISIVSCLQTISLSTLGSMYPGHDLPKHFLCKKPYAGAPCIQKETNSKNHSFLRVKDSKEIIYPLSSGHYFLIPLIRAYNLCLFL